MGRPKSTPDNGGTATAEPKTRARKTPKMKAESLTVKAINALDALGCMAGKLSQTNHEEISSAVDAKVVEMKAAFDAAGADEDAEEPEPFKLSD
jgi:hypothetical protein